MEVFSQLRLLLLKCPEFLSRLLKTNNKWRYWVQVNLGYTVRPCLKTNNQRKDMKSMQPNVYTLGWSYPVRRGMGIAGAPGKSVISRKSQKPLCLCVCLCTSSPERPHKWLCTMKHTTPVATGKDPTMRNKVNTDVRRAGWKRPPSQKHPWRAQAQTYPLVLLKELDNLLRFLLSKALCSNWCNRAGEIGGKGTELWRLSER